MAGVAHKKGRWYIVLKEKDTATGKWMARWLSPGYRTEDEARRTADLLDQEDTRRDRLSAEAVESYLLDWLNRRRHQLRQSTWESYREKLRCHVLPRIGMRELQRLTGEDLDILYSDLLEAGLGPRSVRYVHAVLRKAFNDATRKGRLERNPALQADPPKARRVEMRTWTPEQVGSFLMSVRGQHDYSMWVLYSMTGMRRGEVLGLRWSDMDLDAGVCNVRQAIVRLAGGPSPSEPKTDKGRRVLSLDALTVSVLRDHRIRELESNLGDGRGHTESDLVYSYSDGSPLKPDVVSKRFKLLARKAELPPIRLHDLRHTHATIALLAGVPDAVMSDRLGHSSRMVLKDIYQHVLPGMDRQAAERVAAAVFGAVAEGTQS